MGLNFGGAGLFQGNPIFGNEGEMTVSAFESNIAELAVWSDNIDIGTMLLMYDRDTTSFMGVQGTGGRSFQGDFGKRLQAVALNIFFGKIHGGGGASRCHIDISDDATVWTEIVTTATDTNNEDKSYSAVHSFRHIRCRIEPSGGSVTGRVYEITVVKTT